MANLTVINETLGNFVNLVEEGKIVEAELMIKYFNNWSLSLEKEEAQTKGKFMELAERFSKLEAKLSKNIQTQNFRFRINSLAKTIGG